MSVAYSVKSWEKFSIGDHAWLELNIELPNGLKHSFACEMGDGEESAKNECLAAAEEWTKGKLAQ